MAINYVISYTFAPNTTISSSNVNTNFSDNGNTWTGLEALTKSFSALRVDATPTASTDVAIKSYVDKLNNYRKPTLQYVSGTVANMETGINGTSGQAQILFPDGTFRTDSTATRINVDLSRVAVLSGTTQSGLRTGTVANSTWYAVYAVKVTDSTANFVAVADTVLPLQANYATLNSNFGTNGWVYLGLLRNGDNAGSVTGILKFAQQGNTTVFDNSLSANTLSSVGTLLAGNSSAASVTWTYAAGTGAAQVPANILSAYIQWIVGPGGTGDYKGATGGSGTVWRFNESSNILNHYSTTALVQIGSGLTVAGAASSNLNISLMGWIDLALGVGANPLL